MCLSATGSPPRRTCARRSLALARAAPMASNAVEPSVTRRLLPARSYWTTQVRAPPARRRSPKPPSSSSQKVLSFVPGRSASVLAAVVVSFMGSPAWAGHGHVRRPPAISCYCRIRGMASCVSTLQALACSCTLLRRLYPNVLNRGVGRPAAGRPRAASKELHPILQPCVSVHDVIDHLAADHGQQGFDSQNLVCRHRQVIPVENQQIGILAWRKRSQVSLLEEKGSIGACVCDQRLFAGDRLPQDLLAPD